ncbi:MAG: LytR family transcriptional regulator [Candidatus Moranbacteria bacterium]|nr:LytR family transcriptional regulator [Candidatus Moranbacteria bacterium]
MSVFREYNKKTQSSFQKNSQKFSLLRTIFYFSIFTGIFIFFGYLLSLGFVYFQTENTAKTIITKEQNTSVLGMTTDFLTQKESPSIKGEESGRINILLLGKAGENYPGKDLTDTIIVASINTQTGQASLLSLPRDLYVPLEDGDVFTKINAVYGMNQNKEDPFFLIRKTISSLLHIDIHYTIAVNYDAFITIIDALGGINVTVDQDIYDTRFPGPNYSYETFELKKGFHTLNGPTALKYVRERHSDPRGDFGRAERQQKTIKAIKNKAFSTQTFLNPITLHKLLISLEKNIRMDISLEEIGRFIEIAQKTDLENIETLVVDAWRKESLLRVSHVYLENEQRMFVLVPRTGTFEEIQELSENIFEYSFLEKRQASIQKEQATITLIYFENLPVVEKIKRLLLDLGFSSVIIKKSPPLQKIPQTSLVFEKNSLSKPYSLDEILKVLPAKKETSLQEDFLSSTDMTILIGKDSLSRHQWEEASLQDLEAIDNSF